jgi:hypothetical protein
MMGSSSGGGEISNHPCAAKAAASSACRIQSVMFMSHSSSQLVIVIGLTLYVEPGTAESTRG